MRLAPRALIHFSLGNAPGFLSKKPPALKARFKTRPVSVPDIAFIEFDAMFAQKIAILLFLEPL
jgi:hypothetical protein